jgi:hypothetical protein
MDSVLIPTADVHTIREKDKSAKYAIKNNKVDGCVKLVVIGLVMQREQRGSGYILPLICFEFSPFVCLITRSECELGKWTIQIKKFFFLKSNYSTIEICPPRK